MENILSMLYHGDGSILETAYEKLAAHILALGKADALEEEFRDKLPQELLPLIDQLKDAVMSVLDTCGFHDFTIGYQLGVRLMIAAMPDEPRRANHEEE